MEKIVPAWRMKRHNYRLEGVRYLDGRVSVVPRPDHKDQVENFKIQQPINKPRINV